METAMKKRDRDQENYGMKGNRGEGDKWKRVKATKNC